MLRGDAPSLPTRPGRKPRVPFHPRCCSARTFDVMKAKGTLGEHVAELFDTRIADSLLAHPTGAGAVGNLSSLS